MVHDLNNMLLIIDGYSLLVKEAHIDHVETLENIRQIEQAASQSLQILLDWRKKADQLFPDPKENGPDSIT